MLRSYNAAVEKLRKWRLESSRPARMVLMAMLEEGYGYAEAVRAYVEFDGRSRTEVEGIMEEEARLAGHWTGARYILEDCYREAIRCERNTF